MKIRHVSDLKAVVNRLPALITREVEEALLLAHERVFGRVRLGAAESEVQWEWKEPLNADIDRLEPILEETQSFGQTMTECKDEGEHELRIAVLEGIAILTEEPTLPTEEQMLSEDSTRPIFTPAVITVDEKTGGCGADIDSEVQANSGELAKAETERQLISTETQEILAIQEAVISNQTPTEEIYNIQISDKHTDFPLIQTPEREVYLSLLQPAPFQPPFPRPSKRILSSLQKRTKSVPPRKPYENKRKRPELRTSSEERLSQQAEGLEALKEHGEKYELLRRTMERDRKRRRVMRREAIERENITAKYFQSRISAILEEEKRAQIEQEISKKASLRGNRLKQQTYSAVVHELHKPSPRQIAPISFQTKLTSKRPTVRPTHSSLSISVTEASPPRKPTLPPVHTHSVKATYRSLSQSTQRCETEPSDRSFSRPKDYLREEMEAKGRRVRLREGLFKYESRDISAIRSPEMLKEQANRLSRAAVHRDTLLPHLSADQQISASDSVSSMYIDSIKAKLHLLDVLTSVTNGR